MTNMYPIHSYMWLLLFTVSTYEWIPLGCFFVLFAKSLCCLFSQYACRILGCSIMWKNCIQLSAVTKLLMNICSYTIFKCLHVICMFMKLKLKLNRLPVSDLLGLACVSLWRHSRSWLTKAVKSNNEYQILFCTLMCLEQHYLYILV